MRIAKFNISGAQLVFQIEENDWCQVELHTDQDQIRLGADKWPILKDKILNALTNLGNSSEPEWMLSLAEEHCSLYRQNIDGKNFFFWLDAQAKPLWRSELVDPFDEDALQIN